MSYVVLVVNEPWHDRASGAMIAKGEVILDQDDVKRIRAERPASVTARFAHPHEVELIEAAKAAGHPVEPEMPADAAE